MAIEFRCTGCEALLRTPDGSGGREAACPRCGRRSPVPLPGTVGVGPADPFPVLPPIPGSPFGAATTAPSPSDAWGRPLLDISDVVRRTWGVFQQQWLLAILAPLIVGGISVALVTTGIAGTIGIAAITQSLEATIATGIVAFLVLGALAARLYTGQTLILLKMAKGQPVELGEIFAGGPYFFRVYLATLVAWPAILAAYCCCFVPGVILQLVWSQRTYLILDRGAGAVESLRLSAQITDGNRLMLFAIQVLAGLAAGAISQFTGGLGTIVAIPFVALMNAVMYLILTGQPIAAPPVAPLPTSSPVQTEVC